MKEVRTNVTTTEVYEGAELIQFSIKPSGKAFKTLIDSMYSDKVMAIIRELSTNAYDSHVDSGKKAIPFEVKLPTNLDQTFYVRDFGTGMTHEQVTGLYSTLFDSSKENTNRQVGMLGLGSKSPFSYVDNFSITVWQNGIERVYSAFLREDKTPFITKVAEQPSTEKTGVKVELEAKAVDIRLFEEKASFVYTWFNPVPSFVRCSLNVKSAHLEKRLISGNGWYITGDKAADLGVARAKQGCVTYPINPNAIPNLPVNIKGILESSTIVIDFPIGTIDVAPSREALSYDEMTCRNIVARCNSILGEISKKIEDELKKCTSRLEAATLFSKLKTNLPYDVRRSVSAKWNDMDVTSEYVIVSNIIDSSNKGYEYGVRMSSHYIKNTQIPNTRKGVANCFSGVMEVRLHEDTVVFYTLNSISAQIKNIPGRLKKYFQTYTGSNSYIIYLHSISEELLAKYKVELSGMKLVDLSAINPDKAVYTKKPPATKKTEVMARSVSSSGEWEEFGKVEVINDCYYLMVKGATLLLSNGDELALGSHPYCRAKASRAIKRMFNDKPLYFVSTSYDKRLRNMDNNPWTNVSDLFYQRYEEVLTAARKYELVNARVAGTNKNLIPLPLNAVKDYLKTSKHSKFYTLTEAYNKLLDPNASASVGDFYELKLCSNILRKIYERVLNSQTLIDIEVSILNEIMRHKEDIYKDYPLLPILLGVPQSQIIEYVSLVDFKNNALNQPIHTSSATSAA